MTAALWEMQCSIHLNCQIGVKGFDSQEKMQIAKFIQVGFLATTFDWNYGVQSIKTPVSCNCTMSEMLKILLKLCDKLSQKGS